MGSANTVAEAAMTRLNWCLIFALSMFGLAMALATVWVVPSNAEPVFWLVIFFVCAFCIARFRSSGHFVHGLLVGIVNSVWVTGAHITFFPQYIAHHAREAAMMQSMPLPNSPRLMMAIMGPLIGVLSGIIIGLLAWIAGRFIRPAVSIATTS
jgi:hypothetical protein